MSKGLVRIGLAGCGSVSEKYLQNLRNCSHAKVVGVCDIIESRAQFRAEQFGIGKHFPSLEAMLDGCEFDMLLNATSMPAHYGLNKLALNAGKHVFSEKPFAPTYAMGKELVDLAAQKGLRLWGAPNAVTSPQFRFMAQLLGRGEIGTVHAAHGVYGHGGPGWGPWFYKEGGGCIFDLGVYNITTLTGLLGPAKSVFAATGTAIPERVIEGEHVRVTADDNAMIVLDHGNAAFSHIQTGFVYPVHFDAHTIELIGTKGAMALMGWDWAPRGVQLRLPGEPDWRTTCTERDGYVWEGGAAYVTKCLVTGEKSLMTTEHALHVVEIMAAAHESARTGRRMPIASAFPWPVVA